MSPHPLLLFLLSLFVVNCNRVTPPATQPTSDTSQMPVGDNSRTSLDWPGLYSSILPMADGPGMETSLQIGEDLTYTLRTQPSGSRDDPSTHTGRFTWIDDGEAIKLLDIDSTDRPIYYEVGENYLRQMDLINRPVEGSLSELYYLRKDRSNMLGRRWQLDSLSSGPVDAAKPKPFLFLSANGQSVTGYAGCNGLRGTYLLTGDSLTFPPVTTTKMACEQLPLERQFLDVLRLTVSYAVEGKTLRLMDSRGNRLATLRETKELE